MTSSPDKKQLEEYFSTPRARELLEQLSVAPGDLPPHVAIIMDGNGRWAKRQGKPRLFGHKAGVVAVREAIGACVELGIDYLTIYSFSSENWSRPRDEVSGIMSLFVEVLAKEVRELNEQNVRVRIIGDLDAVPAKTRRAFEDCCASTAANTGLTLVVALNYGGRADILQAVARCVRDSAAGELDLGLGAAGAAGAGAGTGAGTGTGTIDQDAFAARLSTAGIPDPDLLIRTSGEQRLSNFLLWEAAYAELYFTDELWPDFTRESLLQAFCDYQGRSRRYGGV
ncbi:MAG: polyprenyl diphosphate synthase [Coriobacteriia bacterium]|nr:polyprenyl diphosphate synthase [Coriobacteriia bacterium]